MFSVQVTLSSTGGTVHYTGSSFACSGQLSLVSSLASTLKLNQGIIQGQNKCSDGVVTISQGPQNTLEFSFQGKSGPAATGTLAR